MRSLSEIFEDVADVSGDIINFLEIIISITSLPQLRALFVSRHLSWRRFNLESGGFEDLLFPLLNTTAIVSTNEEATHLETVLQHVAPLMETAQTHILSLLSDLVEGPDNYYLQHPNAGHTSDFDQKALECLINALPEVNKAIEAAHALIAML